MLVAAFAVILVTVLIQGTTLGRGHPLGATARGAAHAARV